jgi:hypothetical protein
VSTPTLWFTSKTNGALYHARVDETGTAQCSVNIKPSTTSGLATADELDRNEGAVICLRCKAKLARAATGVVRDLAVEPVAQPSPEQPKRLTATQAWNNLTLLQREALLGWFLGSYAPTNNAARFPLRKTPMLTHAEKIIAETWKGAER